MKKLLIASAALAMVAGTAQAQSSVTLYGAIGAASTSIETSGLKAANSFNSTAQDYLGTTALGLRGTEDLGGGLSAFFNLEGDLSGSGQIGGTISSVATGNTASSSVISVISTTATASYTPTISVAAQTVTTKQAIFNRQAHVGITSKEFGTISVGRQNDSVKDIEGLAQVYNLSDNLHFNTLVGDRYAQTYKYATPTINGFRATYSYSNAPANTTSDTADGSTTLNSYALSYTYKNYQFAAASGTISGVGLTDEKTTVYGARATFGAFTVGAGVNQNKKGSDELNQQIVSVNYAMGKIDLKGHYIKSDQKGSVIGTAAANTVDGKGYGLMGVYNLSKRTAAYAGYADFDASAGVTNDQKVTTVGLFHRF